MSTQAKTDKTEIAPTSKRVSSIAHDAIDSASGKAEEVEVKIRAEAERLAKKSGRTADEVKKSFDANLSKFEGFIREKPLAAAGIAFAAGALGALLMKRS